MYSYIVFLTVQLANQVIHIENCAVKVLMKCNEHEQIYLSHRRGAKH